MWVHVSITWTPFTEIVKDNYFGCGLQLNYGGVSH